MSDLKDFRELARGNIWHYRGKDQTLHTAAGVELVSDTILNTKIIDAIREVNMDVLEDAEVQRDELVIDQDEYELPGDVFWVKKFIIFNASTDLRGVPLEQVGDYASLVEGGPLLQGKPTKFMFNKRTPLGETVPLRFVQFDRTPDDTYTVEIHYWKMTDAISGDSDVPDIFVGYHELIEYMLYLKIAPRIRDFDAVKLWGGLYAEKLKKVQKLQRRFNTGNTGVRYGDLNRTWHNPTFKNDKLNPS